MAIAPGIYCYNWGYYWPMYKWRCFKHANLNAIHTHYQTRHLMHGKITPQNDATGLTLASWILQWTTFTNLQLAQSE